jgi:hypothetical protein
MSGFRSMPSAEVSERALQFTDDFGDARVPGAVVGSKTDSGHTRLGIDRESVISIDHGALRIAPLIEAGFGRAALAYGPFPQRAGLAFAVRMLNGHNTAQAETLPDSFRARISRWLKGSGTDPRWRRVLQFVRSGRVQRTLRQFRWWKRTALGREIATLNENLAVGWFAKDVVPDPTNDGAAFVMHALGPENGELRIGGLGHPIRALRGVQNLPLYLLAISRAEGMVYYVASVEGARGLGSYPLLRPIGVGKALEAKEVYLGIHQSVIGQIGFRLDTRVQSVRVAQLEGYDSWFGGATVADTLTGKGMLAETKPDVGGHWHLLDGQARRATDGVVSERDSTFAIVRPDVVAGMIHAVICDGVLGACDIGFVFRFRDPQNYWAVRFSDGTCEVIQVSEGETRAKSSQKYEVSSSATHHFQMLDDGIRITACLNGMPIAVVGAPEELVDGVGAVGFALDDSRGKAAIRSFEVHPRNISIPSALELDPPWLRRGNCTVLEEGFAGESGDLQGRFTSVGGQEWKRTIGKGTIEISGQNSGRVRGSVKEPCPERTAYTVRWMNHEFVDLEVTITPSGKGRGDKNQSTAGLILHQDDDNYVICNFWLSDSYAGGSVSTFFKFRGFEDLYDAVWTNIGDRIAHGKPTRLRLCSDGTQYLIFLDDEPVLYRAFRDVYPEFDKLAIARVGLVANWEWGLDTGSIFQEFKARS